MNFAQQMSIDTTLSKPQSHSTFRESVTRHSLFDGSHSQQRTQGSPRHNFSMMDSTQNHHRSSVGSPSMSGGTQQLSQYRAQVYASPNQLNHEQLKRLNVNLKMRFGRNYKKRKTEGQSPDHREESYEAMAPAFSKRFSITQCLNNPRQYPLSKRTEDHEAETQLQGEGSKHVSWHRGTAQQRMDAETREQWCGTKNYRGEEIKNETPPLISVDQPLPYLSNEEKQVTTPFNKNLYPRGRPIPVDQQAKIEKFWDNEGDFSTNERTLTADNRLRYNIFQSDLKSQQLYRVHILNTQERVNVKLVTPIARKNDLIDRVMRPAFAANRDVKLKSPEQTNYADLQRKFFTIGGTAVSSQIQQRPKGLIDTHRVETSRTVHKPIQYQWSRKPLIPTPQFTLQTDRGDYLPKETVKEQILQSERAQDLDTVISNKIKVVTHQFVTQKMMDMERRKAERRKKSKKREADDTYKETIDFALRTLDHSKVIKKKIEDFIQDTLNEQITSAKLLSTS